MSITITHLADGRIQLSGKTFDIKDTIKSYKGTWNPEDKTWILPAGTDMSWLRPAAPPVSKPATGFIRRDRTGRCCSAAVPTLDPVCPQGPMIYVCAAHGTHKSSYAGT